MTVQAWLDLLPTTEQIKTPEFDQTPEEAEAHKNLMVALFDGVDITKHGALIVDAVGAMYDRDPRRAIKTCEVLYEKLMQDYALSKLLPPDIKALFIRLTGEGQ